MIESRLFGADNSFGVFRKLLKMYCNICLKYMWEYCIVKFVKILEMSTLFVLEPIVIRTTCTSSPFGMMNFLLIPDELENSI